MKKIGIVTIVDYNYGNRLQNYALFTILKGLGYSVDTIPKENAYKLKKMLKLLIKQITGKNCAWEKVEAKIKYSFFAEKRMNKNNYDYFVAGSDQIWNPVFKTTSRREFLYFAKPEQRVSYAASIGVTELDDSFEAMYGEDLRKFKCISVREEAAVPLIEKIYKQPVVQVFDPVLLLNANEWSDIIKGISYDTNYDYMCMYFLGNMENECIQKALSYGKENNWEVLDILDINRKNKGILGPFEFVKCIRDSKIVVTDSFHATVFSIIFNKPFIVVDRSSSKGTGDMSSRLKSVLSIFNLEDRFVKTVNDMPENLMAINYEGVSKLIKEGQKKSLAYLQEALS